MLKVVATIEVPISHQGAARPDVKNSAVLEPARRARYTAGRNETTIEAKTMVQSKAVSRIRPHICTISSGGVVLQRPRVKSGNTTG